MSPADTSDPFAATWELQTEQCAYEQGQPPTAGTYRIERTQTGYRFYMAWTAVDGQTHALQFDGVPDGQRHPYAGPGTDEISLTRVAANQLDSKAWVGGHQVAHASRVLSDDGRIMVVVQSGSLPDGTPFSNRSVYARLDDTDA